MVLSLARSLLKEILLGLGTFIVFFQKNLPPPPLPQMNSTFCVYVCLRMQVSGRYLVQLDDGRRVKLFPSKLCGHCADPRDGPCQVCKLLRGD